MQKVELELDCVELAEVEIKAGILNADEFAAHLISKALDDAVMSMDLGLFDDEGDGCAKH